MAEKIPGAYIITHEPTGVYYVGSSDGAIERVWQHKTQLNAGTHHAKKLQEAFNQGGELKIEKFVADDREEAFDFEQHLLDQHWLDSRLANTDRYARLSDMNKSRSGVPLTDETKSKMSETRKGRPQTEEHSRAIGNALRGKPKSPEHIAKVVEARKDFKHDEETKARISAKVKATLAAKKAALNEPPQLE